MIRLNLIHHSTCTLAICMIASLGVFFTTTGFQQVYQQGTEEVLEIETAELFFTQRINHRKKICLVLAVEEIQSRGVTAESGRRGLHVIDRFQSVSTERSQLNGLGAYLRI